MKYAQKSIVFVFNSMDIGGIERKIIDLCNYFYSKTKIKIYLLLKNKSGRLLNYLPKKMCVISPHVPDFCKTKAVIFPFWIASQIRIIKPDLILVFGNYCGISSLLAKIFSGVESSLIISEDSSIDKQLDSDTYSWLRKLLVRILYPKANKIIALTPVGKLKMVRLLKNIDESKIVVKPNWLPYTLAKDNASKTRKRQIDLLFLGRFETQKNPLGFLEIAKKLVKINPQINISMVGYGSLEPTMKKYIIGNLLIKNVSVLPATTNPFRYYLSSKILLLSSDHEGFPLTILEASAAGCVPICRLMPETQLYFDYYPKICQYRSSNSALDNITRLLSNSRLRNNIASHYQQKVKGSQSANFGSTIDLMKNYL